MQNRNDRVWTVVQEIPHGQVATYGQIAMLAGILGRSGGRQVGFALASLGRNPQVPWHRVVNANGGLSPRADPDAVEFQRILLEAEGVFFDHCKRIDLARYRWQPEF
ncbi:MAG TPA: methyltransferase [Gammaproteobacteria bacterium]|nr:methyltransferase [Gammaproteobacteria bacterium]|tara:strand:- start:835 stop:1155 length:321 start_codon:yes stop_codon:yes gene_type:complete